MDPTVQLFFAEDRCGAEVHAESLHEHGDQNRPHLPEGPRLLRVLAGGRPPGGQAGM